MLSYKIVKYHTYIEKQREHSMNSHGAFCKLYYFDGSHRFVMKPTISFINEKCVPQDICCVF